MRFLILATAVAFAAPLGAQEKLGTIAFPNSGKSAAQEPFLRGMKLYWSFEYERAADAFKEAQKADPTMALAYVGEALTHTHQVWNQQNVAAAREALGRLAPTPTQRMAKAGSPRERGYVEMAEYLYGDGPKARRDTLFTEAAERLSIANPSDDEAKMFWAIGLLGLNQSVRDFTTYMKAGALAEEVLRRNPEHPAAAHFVIHAFDDPLHAPLGLWAARAYSKIAAGAPHAVHMTSHIYVALGMWDDVIEQNIGASGHDHESYVPGHYTWWLGYGYVQAGRFDEARKHLETVKANFDKKLPRASAAALQMMRAHYVIDGERWTDPAAKWKLTSPPSALGEGTTAFFDGFVAARAGDVAAAKSAREVLSQRLQRAASASEDSKMLKVLHAELGAAIASASRNHDEAVALARSAAADEDAMPFEFGPPQFAKPTHELLGEVLLAANKPAEAKTAFQRSLARMPGRSRSLIGLARAAIAIGDKSTAETAVATLKSNWHAADKSLTELAGLTKQLAAGAR